MRLTLAFGDSECPHPDYLLPRLTGRQLNDWMEFFAQEPWGCDVEDLRALYVAHLAAGGAVNAEKYFEHWARRPVRPPTPEEVVENVQAALG